MMAWCSGGSLSDVLKRYGTVEEERLRRYVRSMLLGLQFLHTHNIIHRDLKVQSLRSLTQSITHTQHTHNSRRTCWWTRWERSS